VAWLVDGTSLDPRWDPEFGWVGDAAVVAEVRAGREIPTDIPSLVLQKARRSRKKSPVPDFFRPAAVWVVCDAFKAMVDALEPGRNQFFPVVLLDKAGNKLPLRYHLMNVTQQDDILDLEKSDVEASWLDVRASSGEVKKIQYWHFDRRPQRLFTRSSQVGAKHLWRGDQHFGQYLFFSEELMARVKKARLRKLVTYPIIEE
jgi:hypothetical protein